MGHPWCHKNDPWAHRGIPRAHTEGFRLPKIRFTIMVSQLSHHTNHHDNHNFLECPSAHISLSECWLSVSRKSKHTCAVSKCWLGVSQMPERTHSLCLGAG